MKHYQRLAALVALLAIVAACRTGPPSASATLGVIQLRHAFAYEPITLASGAAYVEITNQGTEADTLVDVTSPLAAETMFHGGSMTSMTSVVIPAGGTVTFAPGGAHIMLTAFSSMPKAGDSLQLTLTFARAGSVTLELPVRRYGTD
jgi:periplasmic copper chaperone A